MAKEATNTISNALLAWYDAHARALPWRDNPTPYRVWVSEIMLQQTRVDTVIPYFERFMQALPNIRALSEVNEQELFKLWEGLGYYNRARNLQKAAKIVVDQYQGQLPNSVEELSKLPGIGPYTAGAIASIAFGANACAIDGNVLRVIARTNAIMEDIAQKSVIKQIEAIVSSWQPSTRIGDFNQALMELGATVCLPNGVPKCEKCPFNATCLAKAEGKIDTIPVKAKKKPRRIEPKTVFILQCGDQVAILKRHNKGLLSGLWELPNVEGYLDKNQCEEVLKRWQLSYTKIEELPHAKHIFTHIEWHMVGYRVTLSKIDNEHFTWVDYYQLKEKYALPTAFSAYVNII